MALSNNETQEFIRTVLGITDSDDLKVIRKNQSGRSPDKPYAAYHYLTNPIVGAAPFISHEDTGLALNEEISNVRTPILEIQFYTKTEDQALTENFSNYESANEICQRFEDNLKSDKVKIFLREKGFSILSTNPVFNLDQFLGDTWERRSVLELTLNHVSVHTNEVEFFVPPITLDIEIEDL